MSILEINPDRSIQQTNRPEGAECDIFTHASWWPEPVKYEGPANPEPVLDWHEDAFCATVGGDLFYMVEGGSAAIGRFACGFCLYQDECLREAVSNQETLGVRGGLSPNERDTFAHVLSKKGEQAAMKFAMQARKAGFARAQKTYKGSDGLGSTADPSEMHRAI